MIIDAQANEENALRASEQVINYADGLEKAFQVRYTRATTELRRRTQREIATAMVIEKVSELRTFCVDETLVDNLLEKETVLKIDDTFTMPLAAFRARQTVEGVEIEVATGIPAMLFQGAFGPLIPSLNRNIYRRLGKKQFPIQKLRDLKVNQIEGVKDAFDRGTAGAKDSLKKAMDEARIEAKQISQGKK
jgi:hypothetical protein